MKHPVIFKQSPNYKAVPNRAITLIVLHATATDRIESPLAWLTDSMSKVSAHYLLGRDGTLYQLVAERDVAWHAGQSEWKGKQNCNQFSIGIELVNDNSGNMAYPPAQLDVCLDLVADLCKRYSLTRGDVASHATISPIRKNDPQGFPWQEFRERLQKEGIA